MGMGMRKEIDGKLFGEGLLNLAAIINLAEYNLSGTQRNKYRKLLNELQKNTVLKEQWERLWMWRLIPNEWEQRWYFQRQCQFRNPDLTVINNPQVITEPSPEGFISIRE